MLSFQLRNEAIQLLAAFDKASTFFGMLDTINSGFPEIDGYLEKLGEGGEKNKGVADQLRTHLAHLRHRTQKINIREFYASLEEFQRNLIKAKEYGIDDLEIISGISKSIDTFAEKFESYIASYVPQAAAPVVTEARKLSAMLSGFKTALMFFESNLEEQHFQLEEHCHLSILLPTHLSLHQFASKLIAIDSIYSELCSLLNISPSEYPLTISKVESGSLWAKVVGSARIIKLMADFLEATASYIYRNYTNEGKLTAIPRKIESINAVLQFTKKLEKEGVDVSEAKEHLSKSAVHVVKELNSILEGQAEIIINGNAYSVGAEVQSQLLNLGAPLKLEKSREENEDET